ncbi:MAG: PKD domain-containing protein, partial [Anaerolineae bacterium]|nr:PKD domain-containing protein [Anaerolineae bacterium]
VVEPEDVVLSLNTPVVLPAGTWWLVYQAALEYGLYGQYGWSAHSEATWGSIGEQINPGGGFGMGTDWWENSYGYDWMFRLEGTTGGGIVYPDYPWLSEYPVSGTIPPGECTVVDVNFDATGMAPGDYFADLLILSNDPDEPEITLPTAMTVLEAVEIVDVTYDITDLTVTFTPTVNGSEPIAYLWDFGDGVGTSTETNPVYTYAVEGCYTVTLDVVNECGADGWNGEVCVVSACDPVHDAALTWMPLMPIVSETVTFTGTAVGSEPISYAWDFGDGMTATGMVVTHAYAMSGTFTVTLMADNECGHDEAQGLITITEEPVEHYMIYLPVVQKDYLP